jgi:hypothetical protein
LWLISAIGAGLILLSAKNIMTSASSPATAHQQQMISLPNMTYQWIRSIPKRTVWKLLFAAIAVKDLQACLPVFFEGWDLARAAFERKKDPFPEDPATWNPKSNHTDSTTCRAIWDQDPSKLIGTFFCLFCIIEAIIRSRQARQEALEMAALDDFEQKLAQFYSSARWRPNSVADLKHIHEVDEVDERSSILARKTLRSWMPVVSTLLFWGLLLPWWNLTGQDQCGVDTAIATMWIIQFFSSLDATIHFIVKEVTRVFWKIAMPFPVWQIRKFTKRVRALLRWLRYFRFAGPLLRMLLKLSDQLRVVLTTWDQAWRMQAERAKRMAQRNILFDDIRRVESLSRCKTALARVPTFIFDSFQEEKDGTPTKLPPEQMKKLTMKKEEGKKLQSKLETLKRHVRSSSGIFQSADLYDSIVNLSQELTKTVRKSLWNANLISPQTRFSVAWRIIVTFALLSELSRLCTSYQLYGKLNVAYTDMMKDLLGCRTHQIKENVLTATGRFTQDIIGKIFKLVPPPKYPVVSECITSHSISLVLLRMSSIYEVAIDIVCFLDIFVWFFTGEVNADGVVVPKPFIYRCIIPGTLVQVLVSSKTSPWKY